MICGGGATGAAVAYKLAQRGLGPETVMIDKGEVGGGTTVHASGLVGLLKQSKVKWDDWWSLSLPERNGPSSCDVIAGGDQALQDQQRPLSRVGRKRILHRLETVWECARRSNQRKAASLQTVKTRFPSECLDGKKTHLFLTG